MPRAFGRDFGTTNSAVACASEKGVETTSVHRSVLYFEPKAPTVSGNEAIDRYLAADEKGRLIQSLKSFLASRLFTGTNVYGRQYPIEDLLTIFLRDLRKTAEQKFGPFEGTIVVGRPVRYANANNDEDSEFALGRLRAAFAKADIGPIEFEYEPVAAAYFYASTLDHDELILIGDFGGGTSDFSLLQVGPRERSVLGTEGVALAGDAFDSHMVRHLVSPMLGRGSEYRSLEDPRLHGEAAGRRRRLPGRRRPCFPDRRFFTRSRSPADLRINLRYREADGRQRIYLRRTGPRSAGSRPSTFMNHKDTKAQRVDSETTPLCLCVFVVHKRQGLSRCLYMSRTALWIRFHLRVCSIRASTSCLRSKCCSSRRSLR
jgi:Hsp70 protein